MTGSGWKRTGCALGPVSVTGSGRRQTVTNVDHRLKTAIKSANEQLSAQGIEPIGERVSPHSLRRTYASLRAALRDDPVCIAEPLGHTDPAFTFRIYQKAAKRRERLSGTYLAAFDQALHVGRNRQNRRRGGEPAEAGVRSVGRNMA